MQIPTDYVASSSNLRHFHAYPRDIETMIAVGAPKKPHHESGLAQPPRNTTTNKSAPLLVYIVRMTPLRRVHQVSAAALMMLPSC